MFDALTGAGRAAAETAHLFWIMTIGFTAIWLVVTAFALHASRTRQGPWSERAGLRLILIGGCVVPTVVLAGLLAYGMPALARQRSAPGDADVRITVIGEQWWWRVRYELPGGSHVELANEVRLPRNRVTQVTLTSTDVIHSFWIPSIAGKLDMIPGRLTHLTLEPTTAGTFRGVCAEYCGASHARMAFVADVMEPDAFDRWLSSEAAPAAGSEADDVFMANGCAACHAIRGTAATATIGPDLTHVGRRHSIAAGSLPNEIGAITRWLARPDHTKPGVLMPPFEALSEGELRRLAEYMRSLQ